MQVIRPKSGGGFTLIEILITVGVIAVVTAGTMTAIGAGPQRGSRDARRTTDLQSIASALGLYRNDMGQYPTSLSPLQPNYIPSIPADPAGGGRVYSYVARNAAGTGACDGTTVRCARFVLCAAGERNTTLDTVCSSAGANCGSTCSISVVSQ